MTGSRGAASAIRRLITLMTALVMVVPVGWSITPGRNAPGTAGKAAAKVHEVTYDHYSLTIDGRRVLLQAGEFHYFRLPSPDLWRDVMEKFKAEGFNAVSIYFDWAYHSPKAGVYDFTGVRDVDRLLRTAEQAGLYVIARPGPYINAETTGGGFPAWLKNVPGRARTSAPGYTAAYQDWLGHIDSILARHQVTRGGSVVLYNAENEYAANTDRQYMADIQTKARADGIDVPITHNQCCDNASWTTDWANGQGAVQILGVDDYPQSFDCPNVETTWGPWGEGVTERARDDTPVFAAEYQAGSIDLLNAGYEKCRQLTGVSYMKYFHKNNLINSGATAFSYYMGFGGTNWGWLSQPNDVYTSYDYGAEITENRQLTAKYDEFKRQSYFLRAVAPLTKTDAVAAPASSNAAISTPARANPDTGTQFVLVRHTDRAATTDDATTLDWTTPDGHYALPVRLSGRDAKVLVAGYDMGGQRLAVSSSEIMTHAAIADGRGGVRDVALLYGRDGEPGRTVLRYASRPAVKVLAGSVTSSYSDNGDLRLDYSHSGLARVLISGGGRRPLLLLIGTDATAATFWQAATTSGPVLVRGTSLVRSASARGGEIALRADTARPGEVEVFGPGSSLSRLSVNGEEVAARATPSGSLLGSLPGPAAVRLPALTGWRTRGEAPEAAPGFDDARWTVADKTTSESPFAPLTQPVLFADDYGYHYGNVWYRGHFTSSGAETTVSLNAITGKRGRYLVWLNGRYLGSAAGGVEADADAPLNPNPGHGDFAIPAGLLRAGQPATLSVLVENMGHNDDWTADENRHKQPRGLVGASVTGAGSATGTPISWRIQGAAGGENLADTVRGPLNNGGLYGERTGWHLPGYPDAAWTKAAPGTVHPGVTWFRTGFRLDLPKGQDTAVALRFGGDIPQGARAMFFLNGWNLGLYGAEIGPQTDFALPAGLLRQHGQNTLALAVIAEQDASIGPLSLVAAGVQRGGDPVSDVPSPSYSRH